MTGAAFWTLFQKRSKMNVAKRSKMNIQHALLVKIAAFWGAHAVLFNSLTSAFAWQVQHCETVWPDVVGVLLACACFRAEVRPSLLIMMPDTWKPLCQLVFVKDLDARF